MLSPETNFITFIYRLIFDDLSRSIESILIQHHISLDERPKKLAENVSHHPTSMVFSGDTNAINSGVMLFRKSRWTFQMLDEVDKIFEKMQTEGQIGMGYDNAALSIFLGGCSSSSSFSDLQKCYRKVDLGWNNPGFNEINSNLIRSADPGIYRKMIPLSILRHIYPIPQKEWNSYDLSDVNFIYHAVNKKPKDRETLIRQALRNHVKH